MVSAPFDPTVCEPGDGHDHGDSAWEWAGIFSTPDASYTWIAQKVDGDYADPTMSTRAAGPKTLAAACVPASMWVYTAEGAR